MAIVCVVSVWQVSTDELTNGVISFCFMAVFQDMIRLFACYNDGIVNLLGNDSPAMTRHYVTRVATSVGYSQ